MVSFSYACGVLYVVSASGFSRPVVPPLYNKLGLVGAFLGEMKVLVVLLLGIPTASALSTSDLRPTVVVAGATGKAGSAVVRSLVESGGVDVVALVRSADKARALYGDGSGVAIAEADYSDTDALDAVLCQHPACRLFIACANGPQQARLSRQT